MEHPVPQNVTAFEFHLVGDMTLKQFGYLAVGLIIAYLSFVIIFPVAPVLAVPVIIISTICGVAFAFLPINDRPLDHWVVAFFKAVYSPTRWAWILPSNPQLEISPADPFFSSRLQNYLNANFQITPPIPAQRVNLSPLRRIVMDRPAPQLPTLPLIPIPATTPHLPPKVAAPIPSSIPSHTPTPPLQAPVKPQAVTIPTPQTPKTLVTLTSLPNVINGIVTDSSGNYIEGAIVIINNHEGLPVRALKTNKLGQFTGTSPLPDGIYVINIEKDDYYFLTYQITLNGQILGPLQIPAKIGGVAHA